MMLKELNRDLQGFWFSYFSELLKESFKVVRIYFIANDTLCHVDLFNLINSNQIYCKFWQQDNEDKNLFIYLGGRFTLFSELYLEIKDGIII